MPCAVLAQAKTMLCAARDAQLPLHLQLLHAWLLREREAARIEEEAAITLRFFIGWRRVWSIWRVADDLEGQEWQRRHLRLTAIPPHPNHVA